LHLLLKFLEIKEIKDKKENLSGVAERWAGEYGCLAGGSRPCCGRTENSIGPKDRLRASYLRDAT
jgi:hypothetical protein